jgi:hypothetical protein
MYEKEEYFTTSKLVTIKREAISTKGTAERRRTM